MVGEEVDGGRGSRTCVAFVVFVNAAVDAVALKCVNEDVDDGRGGEGTCAQDVHVGVVVGIISVGGPKWSSMAMTPEPSVVGKDRAGLSAQ